MPRGVGACIHTLPESVVSLIPWRPRCSEEAAVPLSGQTAVKEALFQRRDVCRTRQQTGEFCADPFLSIPAVRQLSAGKGVGRSAPSSGSPQGAEGGRWKTSTATAACIERARRAGELRQQRLRASSARGGQEKALHRGLCGAARRGSDLRAGEKVRERAGVAGARAR